MFIQKLFHTSKNINFNIYREPYTINISLNFIFLILLILCPFHGKSATCREFSFQKEEFSEHTLAYLSVSLFPPNENRKIAQEKKAAPDLLAGVEYLPMILLEGEYLPVIVKISPATFLCSLIINCYTFNLKTGNFYYFF